MNKPIQLIDSRGSIRNVEGSVLDCSISRDGKYIAFATAEGELWLASYQQRMFPDQWKVMSPHEGGILCLAQDASLEGFLTGGDDQTIQRIIPDQLPQQIAQSTRWIENLVSWYDSTTQAGIIAFSAGKQVELYKPCENSCFATLLHESTVSGLAITQDGKKLATSYYNGASLWDIASQQRQQFDWKGSHIGIIIHPKEEALVTAMQENDLHGWRLSDGHNMRMSGYPIKVKSLSFSSDGRWLATSGTENVVMWPFFDGGPIGKPPIELPGIPDSCCTKVDFHPTQQILAAGFLDGSVLLISTTEEKVLVVCLGHEKAYGAITALRFSPEGGMLAFGTDQGIIALVDLSKYP